MGISVFVCREEVVEEVLKEYGDHGVGGNPGVVGGEADPQALDSFIADAPGEAVDEAGVGQHALSVWVEAQVLGFILRILVLTLSKGSDISDTAMPDIADATNRMFIVSFFSPRYACRSSFDWLYPTRWEQFTDIALATVGIDPRHIPLSPSSL